MLCDHERRTLRAVERDGVAERPDFVRSFQAGEQRPGYGSTATLAMMVAALIGATLLIAGSSRLADLRRAGMLARRSHRRRMRSGRKVVVICGRSDIDGLLRSFYVRAFEAPLLAKASSTSRTWTSKSTCP